MSQNFFRKLFKKLTLKLSQKLPLKLHPKIVWNCLGNCPKSKNVHKSTMYFVWLGANITLLGSGSEWPKDQTKSLAKKRIFYCTSLKSTEYKKLAQNALRFTFWNLKSCISHEKNETNSISFQFFTHRFNIFILFFTWFSRFQILISELQSIWQMLLVLSWLYLIV